MIYKTKSDGNIYKQLRKEIGLTQTEVAKRLSLEFSAVSRWERGVSIPDPQTLPKVAALYGTTVDYLLTGKDAPARPAEPPPAQKSYIEALLDGLSETSRQRIINYAEGAYIAENGETPEEAKLRYLQKIQK